MQLRKAVEQTQRRNAKRKLKLLLPAACGCGPINPEESAYIHSKAMDANFCDIVCLCKTVDAEYDSEGIEFHGEMYSRSQFKELFEVIEHG